MKKCSQCGKSAMYQVEGGHLLCLDCYYKYQSIHQQEMAQLIAHKNFLIEQMEATVGLHGLFPRHQIPQSSPVINRNIHVTNSNVGAINTGFIDNLNVNLNHMAQSGNADIAKQLKVFTEKMLQEVLTDELKTEVLEHVDFLTNQLAGKEPPKKGMIKSVLSSIPLLISSSESLINIWNPISEIISKFIQ